MAISQRNNLQVRVPTPVFALLIYSIAFVLGETTADDTVNNGSFGNSDACDMCAGLHGAGVLDNVTPSDHPLLMDPPSEGTCADWSNALLENALKGSADCVKLSQVLAPQCCDRSNMTASYVCEAQLKSELLGEDSGYETTAIPVPAGEDKLDVTVVLTFWHITNVNTVEGTAEMFFTTLLFWKDERLVWDPAEHDGCLDMAVRSSLDVETTDIYVPDFDLLNRIDGYRDVPDTQASVRADGQVIWERNGVLKAVCAYVGLGSIPFDTLGCYLMFGSEVNRNDQKINYVLGDVSSTTSIHGHKYLGQTSPDTPGLVFADFPSKFQEFSMIPDRSKTWSATDEGIPGQVLTFQFYFERANHYYITKIVIPAILFTFMSFGMFLLDQRVGERLGFGVSLLLVMVTNSIVTSDMLPTTDQLLWIDTFALASYYWVIIAVLESVVVAYLYFLDSEEEERKEEEKQELISKSFRNAEEARLSKKWNDEEDEGERFEVDDSNTNVVMESAREIEVFDEQYNIKSKEKTAAFNNETVLPSSCGEDNAAKRLSFLLSAEAPAVRWRLRIIQKMDHFCLIFLPLTYLLFVVLMFATAKHWA